MYLTRLKALVVESLQQALQASPNPEVRTTRVGIEFPMERQHYPGIWVDYSDSDSLVIAGIDHHEYVLVNGNTYDVTRWKFAGEVSLTAVALSSLERDNIYDELVRVFAFGAIEDPGGIENFRYKIENNDFLAMLANFDKLRPGGNSSAPGTPWGTEDEVIYEKTVSFEVEGEFVSNPTLGGELVLLSAVLAEGYRDGQPVPRFTGETLSGPSEAFDPYHWH